VSFGLNAFGIVQVEPVLLSVFAAPWAAVIKMSLPVSATFAGPNGVCGHGPNPTPQVVQFLSLEFNGDFTCQ